MQFVMIEARYVSIHCAVFLDVRAYFQVRTGIASLPVLIAFRAHEFG
jgi:hypothetical protein